MRMSRLVDLEEEMEYERGDVYTQLEKLAYNLPKYLCNRTRNAIWTHLANFHFGYDWVEDGQELFGLVRTEKAEYVQKMMGGFAFDDVMYDLWDCTHYYPYDTRAEDWEYWLDNAYRERSFKWRRDSWYSGDRPNTHLPKPDKTELWNRPTTWRRLNKHLTKAKLQKHQQRHQPQM